MSPTSKSSSEPHGAVEVKHPYTRAEDALSSWSITMVASALNQWQSRSDAANNFQIRTTNLNHEQESSSRRPLPVDVLSRASMARPLASFLSPKTGQLEDTALKATPTTYAKIYARPG